MIRRSSSRSLRRERRNAEENLDPSSALVNLSDCMLVLAVGLMVALIAHYGVDLSNQSSATAAEEVMIHVDATGPDGEDQYEDLGVVYRDKQTGQMYIVKRDGVEDHE